ncbi:MAG: hypothetical protein LBR66_07830 [Candidatus Symbiothrix sp.]|jgi:hypothetical protein|nr:hypothetical protein [Candidatus Symbiothrix sp.]
MKHAILICSTLLLMVACSHNTNDKISKQTTSAVIDSLSSRYPDCQYAIAKGVMQIAKLWKSSDGSESDFKQFCTDNFIADPTEKQRVFLKISDYLEAIEGHFLEMSLTLQRQIHEATGDLDGIDESFAAYNPAAHWREDFYGNKLAFKIALNFPELSLAEKENLSDNRLSWAYARLGDYFTARIPAEASQAVSTALANADVYIANYNIYAGHLIKDSIHPFPKDMILLAHWNLRDEIKADYSLQEEGLDKQRTIYEVMKHIIAQDIPKEVINSGNYDWDPFTNTLYKDDKVIEGTPEANVRYQTFLDNFHALKALDKYTGKTYIERNFSDDMEVSVNDAEELLKTYLSAPEIKDVGVLVKLRLGRPLEAFDIWYDGFKPRSTLNEDELSNKTRLRYPTAADLERDLPNILIRLGFSPDRATYLTDKIEVDAARGSGHAWGAAMKGDKAHLRTRIPQGGLDYKGYNIAIHEFGHNVEQTISLYDIDYYMLNGVPNTAFTEALAFVFQQRDLELLNVKNDDPEKEKLEVLDKAWQLFEIGGVSLLDIQIWKWLYAHPEATADELHDEVIRLAKEIWNEYYAPIFRIKDQPILAIYSHMISYPLYLTAYSYGQIIQFQLEEYLKNKNLAQEVDRIYRLGRLTPNRWMIEATGKPLSVEPLLKAINE